MTGRFQSEEERDPRFDPPLLDRLTDPGNPGVKKGEVVGDELCRGIITNVCAQVVQRCVRRLLDLLNR